VTVKQLVDVIKLSFWKWFMDKTSTNSYTSYK